MAGAGPRLGHAGACGGGLWERADAAGGVADAGGAHPDGRQQARVSAPRRRPRPPVFWPASVPGPAAGTLAEVLMLRASTTQALGPGGAAPGLAHRPAQEAVGSAEDAFLVPGGDVAAEAFPAVRSRAPVPARRSRAGSVSADAPARARTGQGRTKLDRPGAGSGSGSVSCPRRGRRIEDCRAATGRCVGPAARRASFAGGAGLWCRLPGEGGPAGGGVLGPSARGRGGVGCRPRRRRWRGWCHGWCCASASVSGSVSGGGGPGRRG